MKVPIELNSDNCRGCRRCEMACSWQKDGMMNPRNAGIKIHHLDEAGKHLPMLNQQCYEEFCGREPEERKGEKIPVCVHACVFDALTLGHMEENYDKTYEKEGGFDNA